MMHRNTGIALAAAVLSPAATAQIQPHAGMLRYPDVSASQIVFCSGSVHSTRCRTWAGMLR